MTAIISTIEALLKSNATLSPEKAAMFFKTGPGMYGAHDRFIGVPVPKIRHIAKDFKDLKRDDLSILIASPFNEMRFLALVILTHNYQKSSEDHKKEWVDFYLNHKAHVNNWNLVDASAHLILGDYLLHRDKNSLLELAQSNVLWDRRIAIVATWAFIKNHDLTWTFRLAEKLLHDTEDLMHKAVGWMLREAGKRNVLALESFLHTHKTTMPRTMLRYALEKFPKEQREKIDF